MTLEATVCLGEDLDINDQFAKAYELCEHTQKSVFITGKAGTGKSTLLEYFRKNTRKKIVVLAPTGVAAVNVSGQTIHSFFKFKPDITPDGVNSLRVSKSRKALYENLKTIVIDEISMVRADLLDCMNSFLQLHGPHKGEVFGGVQMILIGDLLQLSPVVTRDERPLFRTFYQSPFFFDAKGFESLNCEVLELKKIYRQSEEEFIHLLGAIRNRLVTEKDFKKLNERFIPHFQPPKDEFFIYLTTTNAMANDVNQQYLGQLLNPPHTCDGEITGQFKKENLPTQETLELKEGAQVMLLNNDPMKRWHNGTIGRIKLIQEKDETILVELPIGREVEIKPFTWEMYQFAYNKELEIIESEEVGTFTQFPIRLAWAVTIHKSQGKTFSKVIVDLGRGSFAHGQTYVALSRCTRFDGIVLKKPISKKDILLEWRVIDFMRKNQLL